MSVISSAQASYQREGANYDSYGPGGANAEFAEHWLDPGGEQFTVDQWRHRRGYAHLDPILRAYPTARWLTIGDGRFASDARYLKRKGARVVATDICGTLLAEAHRRGAIDEYRIENAEALSCGDDEFDWVLCKESYHHFPRPMTALYEMLRVGRRGVVLIEPFDRFYHSPLPEAAWNYLKSIPARLARRYHPQPPFRFEPAGNFIYTISRREIEKAALALDLSCVAFRAYNDCYIKGVEREPAVAGNAMFKKVQKRIAQLDLLCRLRLRQPQLLAAVIFKESPMAASLEELRGCGFEISHLPPNPYR